MIYMWPARITVLPEQASRTYSTERLSITFFQMGSKPNIQSKRLYLTLINGALNLGTDTEPRQPRTEFSKVFCDIIGQKLKCYWCLPAFMKPAGNSLRLTHPFIKINFTTTNHSKRDKLNSIYKIYYATKIFHCITASLCGETKPFL